MEKIICSWIAIALSVLISSGYAGSRGGMYSDINDELMNSSHSEAMAGSDLSMSSGASPSSTPANLAFDSLSTISLSYANYFHNAFSTSLLSFTTSAGENLGYGITAGYVYLPQIEITEHADTNGSGEPVYDPEIVSCSSIFFRIGLGWKTRIRESMHVALGGALNGRRTRLPDYRGYRIGMDLGAKMLLSKPGVSIAVSAENLISDVVIWSDAYEEVAYPHLRVGLGWEKEFPYIYGRLRIGYTTPDLLSNEGINYIGEDELGDGVSIEKPEYFKLYRKPSLLITAGKYGLEYTIMSRFALRGGLTQGKFSFGAGILLFGGRAGLDYSYSAAALAGTSQVSLTYRW
ncbi:MAG: hypothetical protein GX556_19355 [Fibrobacter sp.]|nr:hypothetical protein [Fibrobacter sp.]